MGGCGQRKSDEEIKEQARILGWRKAFHAERVSAILLLALLFLLKCSPGTEVPKNAKRIPACLAWEVTQEPYPLHHAPFIAVSVLAAQA